jgi:hypothetical protein
MFADLFFFVLVKEKSVKTRQSNELQRLRDDGNGPVGCIAVGGEQEESREFAYGVDFVGGNCGVILSIARQYKLVQS